MTYEFGNSSNYVANNLLDASFLNIPKYTWQWCFDGDWQSITFSVVKPPCLFYRIAQRLIFGIHWRPIK